MVKNNAEGWYLFKPNLDIDPVDFFNMHQTDIIGDSNGYSFSLNRVDTLPDTSIRYIFKEKYHNIYIEGGDFFLFQKNSFLESLNGKHRVISNDTSTASFDSIQALNTALSELNIIEGQWDSLVVYHDTIPVDTILLTKDTIMQVFTGQGDTGYFQYNYSPLPVFELYWNFENQLVYNSTLYSRDPMVAFDLSIDAQTGDILRQDTLQYSAYTGTGTTHHDGDQYIQTKKSGLKYILYDDSRGGHIHTFKVFKDYSYDNDYRDSDDDFGFLSDRPGATIHWGVEKAWDYFYYQHGQYSWNNTGMHIPVYVINSIAHSGSHGADVNNAKYNDATHSLLFWESSNYNFSPLDIVAHEFTHGVTHHMLPGGFAAHDEAGALDEGFADIFGAMVEWEYGTTPDWQMGEDGYSGGVGTYRSFSNPSASFPAQPDTYQGDNWIDYLTNLWDNGGTHENCSILTFWFYLLANGGSGTNDVGFNYNVTGIGRTESAQIAYRTLIKYMTKYSNFHDARNASIRSAAELFGICSPETEQTINAWDAVNVKGDITGLNMDLTTVCTEITPTQNTFFAIRDLYSDCDISGQGTTHTEFIAGNSICLKPGFKSNSNFHAYISPCLPGERLSPMDALQQNPQVSNQSGNVTSQENLDEISFYPNPATNKIFIQLPESLQGSETQVVIANSIGQPVKTVMIHSSQDIDVSKLRTGLYIIGFQNQNVKHCSKKLIVNQP